MAGLGYRMAMLLDAIMPVLEAERKREAAREQGKIPRCVTWREREKAARKLLEEAEEVFGYEP
jgi:hypothetical protein